MAKCKACNESSDDELCSETCITIMEGAKERVLKQKSLFHEILNRKEKAIKEKKVKTTELTCKECGAERRYRTTLCDECRKHKKRVRNREYKAKQRGVKVCKNENCKKVIPSNKQYCSDDCKPNYNFTENRRLMYEERSRILKEQRKNADPYEGTVNSKWIQPRGSKKRKEMGLEYTKYGIGKDSDTGGAFIY